MFWRAVIFCILLSCCFVKNVWASEQPEIASTGMVAIPTTMSCGTDTTDEAWWDFGDNEYAEGCEVAHTYTAPGRYSVTVLVLQNGIATTHWHNIVIAEQDQQQLGALQFTEVMPNPSGPDTNEWIELHNNGPYTLWLYNISIRDASDKEFVFADTKTIKPYEYLVLPKNETKITLNNTGDRLTLFAPDGTQLDSVEYKAAYEGKSYARASVSAWQWTDSSTPGNENIFPKEESVHSDAQTSEEILQEIVTEEFTLSVENDDAIMASTATTGDIIISELYPAPSGDDRQYEFIELYNAGGYAVHLADWSITDTKQTYYFPQQIIDPQEYLLLEREQTRIALNNTGDTVYLYDANEELVDEISYTRARTDYAYVFTDSGWQWSEHPSPGEEHTFFEKPDADEGSELVSTVARSLVQSSNKNTGDQISVQGVVTALPGDIGSQIIYIQDATKGVQVFLYSKAWPGLMYGDVVLVTGELSSYYGEPRIKVATPDDIVVLTTGPEAAPIKVSIAELSDEHVGALVELTGVVSKATASQLILSDPATWDEIPIQWYVSDINTAQIEAGQIITVVGVLRTRNAIQKVYVRSQSDITLASKEYTSNSDRDTLVVSPSSQIHQPKQTIWIGLYAVAGLVIGVFVTLLYNLKRI